LTDSLRPASSAEEGDPSIEKTGRSGPIERGHAGGAAMTGETGALTPEETGDEEFIPAELREAIDSRLAGMITDVSHGAAERRLRREWPPPDLAEGEGGYGGHHGLSPDDPAYHYDVEPVAPAAPPPPPTGREQSPEARDDQMGEPGPRREGDPSKGASDRL